MDARFKKIRNVLIIILALNWLVAGAKIIYGLITKSSAMSADGFHSFSDGASNIIGLIGITIAYRPKDKNHPYGHKKYETFASILIAILLFIIAFNLIRNGIIRFFNPEIPDVTYISFIVMLTTIAINIGVYIYEKAQSKLFASDILAADSYHTRSDILISVSVLATLVAIKAGFPMMDTFVSIFIAILIIYSAIRILKESSDVLCDKAVISQDKIKNIVESVPEVKGCHNIRTRGRLDDIHVDLHVLVDPTLPIGKAHALNHKIQKIIKAKLPNITDIAIHIEPLNSVERLPADRQV